MDKKIQRKKPDETPNTKPKKEATPSSKANMVEYYMAGSSKQVKDIKIFNPVLYEENIALKNKYEK